MENRFSCSAGRAKLIDPNNFGLNLNDNFSVPLEDLNVSVILKSFRKGRTLLTGDDTANISENIAQIDVNFIEGSELGGKKVLTSKFTDLTTVFDKDVINDETLGITSIDIEFNSSYVPMITINFVDVRGSSIFQNEENILNNKGNKYNTFFQLPYPMFELEIKGFYGLPVKYCLHLLKFNTKFNSQTGNFEITCEFIGYTFALLSDMLLGYLRAIPYTKIGAERLSAYTESTGSSILTLDTLAEKISNINKGIKKEASDSEAAKQINTVEEAKGYLTTIKNRITTLGSTIDLNKLKTNYDFIILKHVSDFNTDQKTAIDSVYIENVKTDITAYNALANENYKLTEADFTNIKTETNTTGGKLYKKITIEDLDSSDATVNSELKTKFNCKNDSELLELKKKILDHILKYNKDSGIGDTQELDIFDMSLLNKKLDEFNKSLGEKLKEEKTTLAKSFGNNIRDEFGFDPTIRPIVEIFTAAIEIFAESIYQVSKSAESNSERTAELAQKFTVDDINTGDYHKIAISGQTFFPWPDYREKQSVTKSIDSSASASTENSSAYVEKYLGAEGVLTSPSKVDELVFIDDLLQAFRKSFKSQQETINNAEAEESTWFPINAFDSVLFSETEPYTRYEFKNASDIARLMVIRFMTFIGYSYNPKLMTTEQLDILLAGLAQIEIDAMLRGVKDSTLKKSISDSALKVYKEVKGDINNEEGVPVLTVGSGIVKYNYIYNGLDWKILPVNKGFYSKKDEEVPFYPQNLTKLINLRDTEGYIFFTNYGSATKDSNGKFEKSDDGGTYLRIIDKLDSPKTLYTAPQGVTTDSTILLEKIKKDTVDSTAGFNPFGGLYGVQEFNKMDWGQASLSTLPFMYVFYKDSDTGLALTRKASGAAQNLGDVSTASEYFYNGKTEVKWLQNPQDGFISLTKKKVHHNLGKNRELFNKITNGGIEEVTYPYIEYSLSDTRKAYDGYSFSLFGSDLYYRQAKHAKIKLKDNSLKSCGEYSRAYLFLHTLPFNVNTDKANPFNNREILNLFRNSSGIIHAPRLWCAYVGAILWRLSAEEPKFENGKITGGGSGDYSGGKTDPISWGESLSPIPTLFEYTLTLNINWDDGPNYPPIEENDLVRRLPRQVKREFIRVFLEFVNGDGPGTKWRDIADKLELFNTSDVDSYDDFLAYFKKLKQNSSAEITKVNDIINFAAPNGTFKSTNNKTNASSFYDIIVPLDGGTGVLEDNNLFLELRDGTSAVKVLLNALTEEVGIVNSTYRIWGESGTDDLRKPIQVDEAIFDTYFNKVGELLKTKSDEFNPTKENEKADLAVFGTSNQDVIKLQLYRTCKNIYDKWLSGAKDVDSLIFQCGGRSLTDTNLAVKYTGKQDAKPRMIDSFRFVARNFRDVGDQLYINPLPINDMLLNNTNTSSYDMISKILGANNFNFQPLPNFINFNDEKIMTSLFQPFNYGTDEIPKGACGPSFVCVYAGQSSKHLDFGDPSRASAHSSKYPNDGFDLRCYNGNGLAPDAPSDIVTGEGPKNWEEPVSAFVVKYSQQNQNFFKDIQLDQSEFSETDESLKIQDEISQKGAENNRSIVGQNIYNVYAVRSYTAKIEMMGNAMIQPMMFFQLDNIPMFHGAYLITNVSHSIRPNSMSTNFKGTRIRYPETPLVSAYDVYMSFLETVDTTAAGTGVIGGSGGVPNSSAPILQTLIDNGCSGSNINSGNIKSCKVDPVDGVKFMLNPNTQMICEAVEPLRAMLKDWVKWMKDNGFKAAGEGKSYAYITSMFRTNGSSSMHAYGLAVDFQFFTKEGNIFRNQEENTSNVKNAFDFTKNPALKWLYQHAYEYGFVQPHWANDGNKVGSSDGEEWWHWEYHGKAAIYQLRNRPIPAVGNNSASDNPLSDIKESKIKSFVHNPKGKDGKEAVYKNMDYKTTRVSDKSNKIYNSVSDYPKGPLSVKSQTLSDLKVNANSIKFYDKLLDKLGAPKTEGNKFFLIAWHQIENSTCKWNAFNTKQQYGSSTACITSGVNKDVQNYSNMDEGVNGTYKTLINGNYPNIIAALKSGMKTKQDAYNVAVELQKAPAGDLCVWKQGGTGCKTSGGVPATTYVAQILGTGKMSGKSIAGS